MWIEEVSLENVKCFQSQTIKLGEKDKPYPWVTFLGENGTGKTTVLQAIGLLLAGPEGTKKLGFWPIGWSRTNDNTLNHVRIGFKPRIEKGDEGAGEINLQLLLEHFPNGFCLGIDGDDNLTFNVKVIDDSDLPLQANEKNIIHFRVQNFLRGTLYSSNTIGWFGAGYGAFRRLSKEGAFSSKRPEFVSIFNFASLFKEEQPIETFEPWLMYLDHVIAKNNDPIDKNHLELAKSAINSLLPDGNTIEGADVDGKIWFNVKESRVPTIALSDGFRSILALAGDLIWRLIQAFPESKDPLKEQGVVVIDELDIHLHPKWQRTIAGLLRKTFPNIQFIVATHSPIVAAGAGSDAITYGFYQEGDQTKVERIDHLWAQSVDDILKSPAFGLVSEFSEETQEKIDTYLRLRDKKKRTKQEEHQYQLTIPFVREALGPGMEKTPLELEIEAYIKEHQK